MSDTKFTPGPWGAEVWEGDVVGLASGKSHSGVHASVFVNGKDLMICPCGLTSDEESKANAHLIAAAPDLYNALEVLANYCEIKGIPTDAAFAALKKARGES